MIYYTALGASIVLNAWSLILLKSYAVAAAPVVALHGNVRVILTRLLDARLVLSVFAYGVAAAFWLVALVGVDLMVAYPSLALTYVAIGLASPRLFAEELSPQRWAGIILIVAGVVVMNV